MLSLIMMLSLQVASPTAEPGCRAIDNRVVHQFVQGIRAHPDWDGSDGRRSFIHVANLLNYWGSLCKWDRENADKFVVVQIASLLDVRFNRWNVARMLAEVGPNLRYALGPIKAALNDESEWVRASIERCEEEGAADCLGGSIFERPLECVSHKARTGRRHPDLCLWIGVGARDN